MTDKPFSAKFTWDGHGWKARDLADCPFGNKHYVVSVAPGTPLAVYCKECEQFGQAPLQGERLGIISS